MTKITEIIPEDMPGWMRDAMDKGTLFHDMAEFERKHTQTNVSRELGQKLEELMYEYAGAGRLSIDAVAGALDNLKHKLQHEFLPIKQDMIDYEL